jgi:DNA end-binding protein Ku
MGRDYRPGDSLEFMYYNRKFPQAIDETTRNRHFQEASMAARSIASLTVSFGLVSIPVRLFSATEASKAISFNLLHKACGSRLRQQYFCMKEEVPVAREDMVKGYEFAKDQYVMFTPEELKALEETGTHMAEIAEFVPLDAVDPVYFDKAYYLAPDKGGAKPYALLREALLATGRCALGRWAARGKQYIVMIRAVEEGLVMQQLLYADEVRSIKEIEIAETEVKPAELKLAQMLIEQQSSDKFDPSGYTDQVRGRIEKAVQGKVEGQEIVMTEEQPAGAQVIDLMEALRASLEKKGPAAKKAAPAPAPEGRKPPKRTQPEPVAVATTRKAAKKL